MRWWIARSRFLVALGLVVVLATPLAADAQQAGKVWQIGFLATSTLVNPVVDGFRQGLREHGYIEGQNLLIEWRFAEGGRRSPRRISWTIEFRIE